MQGFKNVALFHKFIFGLIGASIVLAFVGPIVAYFIGGEEAVWKFKRFMAPGYDQYHDVQMKDK